MMPQWQPDRRVRAPDWVVLMRQILACLATRQWRPTIAVLSMTPVVLSVALSTGVTLSYAAAGDPAAPVVVLLPGPTDPWRSYEAVLERLPSSVRAIAVSPRGHGDSDKPPAPSSRVAIRSRPMPSELLGLLRCPEGAGRAW